LMLRLAYRDEGVAAVKFVVAAAAAAGARAAVWRRRLRVDFMMFHYRETSLCDCLS
jgi:hypothetical protein